MFTAMTAPAGYSFCNGGSFKAPAFSRVVFVRNALNLPASQTAACLIRSSMLQREQEQEVRFVRHLPPSLSTDVFGEATAAPVTRSA